MLSYQSTASENNYPNTFLLDVQNEVLCAAGSAVNVHQKHDIHRRPVDFTPHELKEVLFFCQPFLNYSAFKVP